MIRLKTRQHQVDNPTKERISSAIKEMDPYQNNYIKIEKENGPTLIICMTKTKKFTITEESEKKNTISKKESRRKFNQSRMIELSTKWLSKDFKWPKMMLWKKNLRATEEAIQQDINYWSTLWETQKFKFFGKLIALFSFNLSVVYLIFIPLEHYGIRNYTSTFFRNPTLFNHFLFYFIVNIIITLFVLVLITLLSDLKPKY